MFERSLNKEQDFKQTGLDWMRALAKVKIGAMLASYAAVSEPFTVFPPTTFDQHAFAELLLDGARSHYWSLTKDPMLVQKWYGDVDRLKWQLDRQIQKYLSQTATFFQDARWRQGGKAVVKMHLKRKWH